MFLDTNIFVRYLLDDHTRHSPLARDFFSAIQTGELVAETSTSVVFEVVFLLNKRFGIERNRIAAELGDTLSMTGLQLPGKSVVLEALELWVRFGRISFPDALHLLFTSRTKHQRIASFDKGMSGCVPGVTRIEQFP